LGRISPLLGPSHSFTPLHRAAQLTQTLGPSRPSAPLPSRAASRLRRSGSTDVWGLCRSVPLVHLPTLKRGTHVVRRFVPVEECVQELSPRGDRAGLANGVRDLCSNLPDRESSITARDLWRIAPPLAVSAGMSGLVFFSPTEFPPSLVVSSATDAAELRYRAEPAGVGHHAAGSPFPRATRSRAPSRRESRTQPCASLTFGE
jgi:hypothetical protein